MRADIVPGAKFPDYELTDTNKERQKLSELQGIDPMILLLSRGHFCPKDHQQHLEAERQHRESKDAEQHDEHGAAQCSRAEARAAKRPSPSRSSSA